MIDKHLGIIIDELLRTGRHQLAGVGAIKVAKRKARPGRNPQTGEEIQIPAHKTLTFIPCKNLKARVNE